MWNKFDIRMFIQWVLTKLLEIIFPFATINSPEGSQQQTESFLQAQELPVSKESMGNLEKEDENEDEEGDKGETEEVEEKPEGDIGLNIDIDAVIAGLDQDFIYFGDDQFNEQLCDGVTEHQVGTGMMAEESYLQDFECCKNLFESGGREPELVSSLASMYLLGKFGAPVDVIKGCEMMEEYLKIAFKEEEEEAAGEAGDEMKTAPKCDPKRVLDMLNELSGHYLGAPTTVEPHQTLPKYMLDGKRACKLLEKAADDYNDILSIKMLSSKMYMTGQWASIGVPFDLDKGMHWLLRGAQIGDGQSAHLLATTFASNFSQVNINNHIEYLLIADKFGFKPDSTIALQNAYEAYQKQNNIHFLHGCAKCGKRETPGGKKFSRCGRCQVARYCSRDCQIQHFKVAHKKECKRDAHYAEEAKILHKKIESGEVTAYPEWKGSRLT